MIQNTIPPSEPVRSDTLAQHREIDPSSLPTRKAISLRVIILGTLLLIGGGWWRVLVDSVYVLMDDKWPPLYITPVAMLFFLVLLNQIIKRYAPAKAFSRGELVSLYLIVVTLSYIGHPFTSGSLLFKQISLPFWRVSQNPIWGTLFIPYVPESLFVSDPNVIFSIYHGGSTLYRADHILPWLYPTAVWSCLLLVITWTMMCIASLLVPPWVERERLAFPAVQVPLAVIGDENFFTTHAVWFGFFTVVFFSLLGALHRAFPSVPMLNLGVVDAGAALRDPPWNVLQSMLFLCFYPWVLGIAYLMPLDLLFSAWFFHILFYAAMVVARVFGESVVSNQLYMQDQSSGAWLALSTLAIWGARKYLVQSFKQAFSRMKHTEQTGPFSARMAVLGTLVGIGLIVAFSMFIGINGIVAIVFWGIFFFLAIGVTRLRAQLGGMHTLGLTQPETILVRFAGVKAIGAADLGRLLAFFWCTFDTLSSPMPNHLEGFRLSRDLKTPMKAAAKVMMFAAIVCLPGIYWASLHMGYTKGAATWSWTYQGHGEWGLGQLQGWLNESPSERMPRLIAIGGMFLFSISMGWLKTSWISWPLHPAGIALALDFSMIYFWFPFLLAWIIKLPVLRYGGIRIHRKTTLFMIGLLLGDFVCRAVSAALGLWIGVKILPW